MYGTKDVCWNESDLCVISGFCCEAHENCTLLGYYSAISGVLKNELYWSATLFPISSFSLLIYCTFEFLYSPPFP